MIGSTMPISERESFHYTIENVIKTDKTNTIIG